VARSKEGCGEPDTSWRQGGADTVLTVPTVAPGTDMLTAALAYAGAGWYILPVRRGTKDPGSVVGKRWQDKSSRDPNTITAWFAGTDYGIALHCGRSGAVVFDVDNPDKLPALLRTHLRQAPFQSTRPDVPGRGHYVFRMPHDRTIGNSVGRLGGGWGEVRGYNGVIIATPSHHADGGRYGWMRSGQVSNLSDEVADRLDDASPALDAATDSLVTAFIAQHTTSIDPDVLRGLISALRKHFVAGESRHQSTVSVLTGAMKEARIGCYSASAAIDSIKPMFIEAAMKPPISDKQGDARSRDEAEAEFVGILAWAVGQALGADPHEIRARVDEKMPDNDANPQNDGETVQTLPWPTLSPAALRGTAGKIVNLVAPHTEADPAAILVQLHAVFGATLGPGPHVMAGNERHPAIIHPLIVGRTNNGAKGTSLGVVEAIRKHALPEFDACTASGLSSAEGLIELVRDPSGDDPDDKNFDPGALDKRLLVKESEYKSVLIRQRREGNTLSQTLRDAFDGKTLRTLTRKHNSLIATGPHIVVIGHVTPREFRNSLEDSDLAGGSVNRLLICLSRRTRLHSRLGNVPEDVLAAAGPSSRSPTIRRGSAGSWSSPTSSGKCGTPRTKNSIVIDRIRRPPMPRHEGRRWCCGCRCSTRCSTAKTRSMPRIWKPRWPCGPTVSIAPGGCSPPMNSRSSAKRPAA
jgi:Bifunctional DNA primase/polymerase, N-terminal